MGAAGGRVNDGTVAHQARQHHPLVEPESVAREQGDAAPADRTELRNQLVDALEVGTQRQPGGPAELGSVGLLPHWLQQRVHTGLEACPFAGFRG